MKRCPVCRRDYFDDSLLYCLDDGVRLVDRAGAPEPATAILDLTEPTTRVFESINQPSRTPNTIAVLPFLNLSRDEDGDYFSDGLAEELLNVLAKIRGLRVAARTSAFSFKGDQKTVGEIGQILNVGSVLEGSIRRVGERLRISVQLINTVDGYQLWAETYDRTMDDIFAVQDDIARCVVEELRIRLLGKVPTIQESVQIISEVALAAMGRAVDPEAQRLMLLGRYFLDRSTRADTDRAIDYFRRALERDNDYPLCLVELARAYSIQAGRGWEPLDEAFRRSREAVERALSQNPALAEAHAQLGRIQAAHDWDLCSAEVSYGRARDLAPGSTAVLDGASILAYKLGRLDEALGLSRQVLLQDPLRTAFWHNLGLTCHAAGLLDEAENAFRRALEFAPQRQVTSALLSLVLMDQGERDESVSQARKEPDEFWRLWALAIIGVDRGVEGETTRPLDEILARFSSGNAYQIAEILAMGGDLDAAFEWLERAINERDAGVTHAKVSPRLRKLHSDERWPDFLKKVGLPG